MWVFGWWKTEPYLLSLANETPADSVILDNWQKRKLCCFFSPHKPFPRLGESLGHHGFTHCLFYTMGFLGGSDGKESACSAGDLGLIPGSGRSPGEANGNHSSVLAWEIPWTEEPGWLQCMGSQRVRGDWVTFTSFHFIIPYPCVNPLGLVTFVPMIPLQISYFHLHSHHTQASSLLPIRVPPNFPDMGFDWSCLATIASLYWCLTLRVWALILSRYLNFM